MTVTGRGVDQTYNLLIEKNWGEKTPTDPITFDFTHFQRDIQVGMIFSSWPSKIPIACVVYVDVSKNNGTPKSSILIGFFIINHPFWGTRIFGNTHV